MSDDMLSNPGNRSTIISADRSDIERVISDVLEDAQAHAFGESALFAIRLALEEAISNAHRHGNQSDPTKFVTLESEVADGALRLVVTDQGDGYDIDAVPDPTSAENIEIPSGRGLSLIHAFMTRVRVHPPGNRLEMCYEPPPGG
jgi:serine/threonine-protein kinase RsbW